MRLRMLAVAAGLAVSGPALADYNLCVQLSGPQTYGVNIEIGGTGLWTPITVQGQAPVCVRLNYFGAIRARSVYATPVQSCGTVAAGNTADVNLRASITEYSDNKNAPVQMTSCTRI
ncbi:MAG: hypothetical protein AB7O45_05480 [Alphaproteobacteria bacterium]